MVTPTSTSTSSDTGSEAGTGIESLKKMRLEDDVNNNHIEGDDEEEDDIEVDVEETEDIDVEEIDEDDQGDQTDGDYPDTPEELTVKSIRSTGVIDKMILNYKKSRSPSSRRESRESHISEKEYDLSIKKGSKVNKDVEN